jgi:CDP-paratose 2-epimerase
MRTIIVTGSAGLIGSETVKRFAKEGAHVVGIDNDMRAQFFGVEASTKKTRDNLIGDVRGYDHYDLDIRDASAVAELFKSYSGKSMRLCIRPHNHHMIGRPAIRKPILRLMQMAH